MCNSAARALDRSGLICDWVAVFGATESQGTVKVWLANVSWCDSQFLIVLIEDDFHYMSHPELIKSADDFQYDICFSVYA
ncbi:hypothetical protein T07_6804 [Trichinella nelsoni]|uniref:Uncharacterized protein n=1 Tax=Trichinella nelsoni TaxID=6336 RepID=A0A0V0RG71_9BILA|nr:hypothetical protein T07_6804 [Trichinella nelsoni]